MDNSDLFILILFWFPALVAVTFVAKIKNRPPLLWLLAAVIFGFFALIILILLPKKKPLVKEPLTKEESRAKYLQMKREFLESKFKQS